MKSIEAVGIENAISRIMGTFSKDEISRNYNLIVYILQCIYEEENPDEYSDILKYQLSDAYSLDAQIKEAGNGNPGGKAFQTEGRLV